MNEQDRRDEALRGWVPARWELEHMSVEQCADRQVARFWRHQEVVMPQLEAERLALVEAGHVFGGCHREQQSNEGMSKVEARRVVAEWNAKMEVRHEAGRHFVGCGHTESQSSIVRRLGR